MDPCDVSVTPPQMTRDSGHEDPQAFVLRTSGLQKSGGLGLPARWGSTLRWTGPPARVLTESSAFPGEPSRLRGETEALCRESHGGRIGSLAEFRLVSRPRLLKHKWLVLRGAHQRDPADPPSGGSGSESPQRLARGIPLHACAFACRRGPGSAPLGPALRSHAPGRTNARACGGASGERGSAEQGGR